MFCLGMDDRLLHKFSVSRPIVAIDRIAKLGRSETTFERAERHSVICLGVPRVLMAESGYIFP